VLKPTRPRTKVKAGIKQKIQIPAVAVTAPIIPRTRAKNEKIPERRKLLSFRELKNDFFFIKVLRPLIIGSTNQIISVH